MANRYWLGADTDWNNTANWSLTSGGAGGASVPGASDVAIFDGNGTGNCTVNVDVGSHSNVGGTWTLTPGVGGIEIQVGYTGTFDANDYDLIIGSTGFDSRAATSATVILGNSNVWGITGSLDFYTSPTDESAHVVMTGSGVTVNGEFYKLTIDTNASVTMNSMASGSNIIRSAGLHIYGSFNMGTIYMSSGGAVTLYTGGAITGGTVYLGTSSIAIQTGSTISVGTQIQGNSGSSVTGTGPDIPLVVFRNYGTDTCTINYSGNITDLRFDRKSTGTTTVALTDCTVTGDITELLTGGSYSYSGTANLSGSGDSEIDITVNLTIDTDKTGDLTLSGDGDVYIGATSTLDDLTLASTFTGTLDLDGNSLTTDIININGGSLDINGGILTLTQCIIAASKTLVLDSAGTLAFPNNSITSTTKTWTGYVVLPNTPDRILYWVSDVADHWNSPNLPWATGAALAGDIAVPNALDQVIFTVSGTGDCTLSGNAECHSIILNNYAQTIYDSGFNLSGYYGMDFINSNIVTSGTWSASSGFTMTGTCSGMNTIKILSDCTGYLESGSEFSKLYIETGSTTWNTESLTVGTIYSTGNLYITTASASLYFDNFYFQSEVTGDITLYSSGSLVYNNSSDTGLLKVAGIHPTGLGDQYITLTKCSNGIGNIVINKGSGDLFVTDVTGSISGSSSGDISIN